MKKKDSLSTNRLFGSGYSSFGVIASKKIALGLFGFLSTAP
jgi:hypothetical protein